jgi:hypothetical protein
MRTRKKGDVDLKIGEKKVHYDVIAEPEVKGENEDLASIIHNNPTQLSQLISNPIWQYMVKHTEKIEVEMVDALISSKTQDASMFIRGAIDTIREYKRLMKEFIKISKNK